MTKSLRSLGAGGGGVLVAHSTTLRRSGRSERHKQQRKPESREHGGPNYEAKRHFHIKPEARKYSDVPGCAALVGPQVHQPDAIREEHDQHHANAEYHGWNEEKKQSQAFEAQVHEVGHDQGGLNEREADQNRDHQVNFKPFVGEKDFDGG